MKTHSKKLTAKQWILIFMGIDLIHIWETWYVSQVFLNLIKSRWMDLVHCTQVRFSTYLSCGFITAIVVNPPESKLAKSTSVHCAPVYQGREWSQILYIAICSDASLALTPYMNYFYHVTMQQSHNIISKC